LPRDKKTTHKADRYKQTRTKKNEALLLWPKKFGVTFCYLNFATFKSSFFQKKKSNKKLSNNTFKQKTATSNYLSSTFLTISTSNLKATKRKNQKKKLFPRSQKN